MNVKIISDQHLEFRVSDGKHRKDFDAIHPRDGENADACIVAGDFDVIGRRSRGLFEELCDREQQVLFVPRNHEYYGCFNMAAVDDALREIEEGLSNLRVLTGHVFEFSGRRVLGDTMWVENRSPDSECKSGKRLSQHPALAGRNHDRHQKFIEWLSDELRPGDIVVTHHLPSERSTPTVHRNSAAQPCLWRSEQRCSSRNDRVLGFTGTRMNDAITF